MKSCYRFCNHCGSEFFSWRDLVEHAVKVARSFGHTKAAWVRHATADAREGLGGEEYERILAASGLEG